MTDPPARDAVRVTYDRIARHFAQTREYPWPEVESFLEGRSGAVGLDVGCGNGRHAEPLAERTERVLAMDASHGLLTEATARFAGSAVADRLRVLQADAATLPVRDRRVDLAVYVATLHHLPRRDLRVASLDELARVLADDGRALVSVWSTAHDRFDADEGFDTSVDWTLPDGEVVERYYHIYDPAEFRVDLDASQVRPVEVFVSSGNCYAVVAPEGKGP